MTKTQQQGPPAGPAEAARFMNAYARGYSAGAFATPPAADMVRISARGGYRWYPQGVMTIESTLTRDSIRTDFTGAPYKLRKGSRVIQHLATVPGAELPDLSAYHWVYAYVEDSAVTEQLRAQGREVRAVRVSAASEIIACWGKPGTGVRYAPVDAATLVQMQYVVPAQQAAAVRDEAEALSTPLWHDDFPYYSDGTWDAVSLRGFKPDDPTWGVKPAEMSKNWWAEHPGAEKLVCDWTVLAQRMPYTVGLVAQATGHARLERVRLLRMRGNNGKGGKLARHTDVTDRAAGTRDGQVVRFHIPLITDPLITMTGWNLNGVKTELHLPAGTMWYLDARKPHAVANNAGIDRIHLVIDVLADAAVREAIEAGHAFA